MISICLPSNNRTLSLSIQQYSNVRLNVMRLQGAVTQLAKIIMPPTPPFDYKIAQADLHSSFSYPHSSTCICIHMNTQAHTNVNLIATSFDITQSKHKIAVHEYLTAMHLKRQNKSVHDKYILMNVIKDL